MNEKRNSWFSAWLALLALTAWTSGAFGANRFIELPLAESAVARDLSGDGSVVVGETEGQAFRWIESSGVELLGLGPDGVASMAHATSADGSVVVGSYQDVNGFQQPSRWTAGSGVESLAPISSFSQVSGGVALGVSADGDNIVGEYGLRPTAEDCGEVFCERLTDGGFAAFRWTSGLGLQPIVGAVAAIGSQATGISADGSIVVGNRFVFASSDCARATDGTCLPVRSFRLPFSDDRSGLQDFNDAFASGDFVTQVSADGQTLVGQQDRNRPFRWRPADGRITLANRAGGAARDVSADGRIIVGDFGVAIDDRIAPLKRVLLNALGLNVLGWTFDGNSFSSSVLGGSAVFGGDGLTAVSDDGLTWVGVGLNPGSERAAFLVELDTLLTRADLAALPTLIQFDTGSAFPRNSSLTTALLPLARTALVDETVTAFATLINLSGETALNCGVAAGSTRRLNFSFQPTDPATNIPMGEPNELFDLAPGASRSLVLSFTPREAFDAMPVEMFYECGNMVSAPIISELNGFTLSAGTTPRSDVLAVAGTAAGGGIAILNDDLKAVFVAATMNLGQMENDLRVSARPTGGLAAFSIEICETDPLTSICLQTPTQSVDVDYFAGQERTFGVFVTSTLAIPPDHRFRRVVLDFRDAAGNLRAATSVSIQSSSN